MIRFEATASVAFVFNTILQKLKYTNLSFTIMLLDERVTGTISSINV